MMWNVLSKYVHRCPDKSTPMDLVEVANDTEAIVKAGQYSIDGKTVILPPTQQRVITLKDIASMEPKALKIPSITVRNIDVIASIRSFMGKKVVVLNFANPVHPGGGYLGGARAQEEQICRCTNLFQSIVSKNAQAYYEYHINGDKEIQKFGSDQMILSTNVSLFKDPEFSLMEEPMQIDVITCAAVNANSFLVTRKERETKVN